MRWPCLESASASTVEAMLNGKAILVSNVGFYQELSDTHVRKIDIENEVSNIQAASEYFYNNPQEALEMGERTRSWAFTNFSIENYARKTIDIVNASSKKTPIFFAVNYFNEILDAWEATGNTRLLKETLIPLELLETS